MSLRQPSAVYQGLRWSPPPRVKGERPDVHSVRGPSLDDPLAIAVAVATDRSSGRIAATRSLPYRGP
jgi:hypothetical protein